MKRSCSVYNECAENSLTKKQANEQAKSLEKEDLPQDDPISDVKDEEASERYDMLMCF